MFGTAAQQNEGNHSCVSARASLFLLQPYCFTVGKDAIIKEAQIAAAPRLPEALGAYGQTCAAGYRCFSKIKQFFRPEFRGGLHEGQNGQRRKTGAACFKRFSSVQSEELPKKIQASGGDVDWSNDCRGCAWRQFRNVSYPPQLRVLVQTFSGAVVGCQFTRRMCASFVRF